MSKISRSMQGIQVKKQQDSVLNVSNKKEMKKRWCVCESQQVPSVGYFVRGCWGLAVMPHRLVLPGRTSWAARSGPRGAAGAKGCNPGGPKKTKCRFLAERRESRSLSTSPMTPSEYSASLSLK